MTKTPSNEVFLLESIIAKMPGHVYWKDKDCRLLGCNDNQARLLGLKNRHDIIGRSAYDMVLPNQPECEKRKQAAEVDANDLKVMKSGKVQVIEEPLVLQNGEKAYYLSMKEPLYDKDNKLVGLLGFSIDITDKKRAEVLQKELEFQQRANAMLKLWSSAIAHEMRTPLTALSMGVSTLGTLILSLQNTSPDLEKSNRTKRKLVQLKEIPPKLEKTIDHANHFIDMTLMKSRAGDAEIKMNLVPLSIASEIDAALKSYPFRDGDENLVHVETKADFTFMGDANFFHHIIFNLLKNAIHYVKKVDKGEIFITAQTSKKENILTFKDTGPGMSEEHLEQLFKPFFTKTKHGTGVGLSLCKNLMESFGGSITCDSVEGKLTEFKLVFPV